MGVNIRYDPKSRDFIADSSPRYFASMDHEVHERDPSLGHAMAAGPDLLSALIGLIGLVELIIPTLEGSQRIGVEQNHRLEAARAAIAKVAGETK